MMSEICFVGQTELFKLLASINLFVCVLQIFTEMCVK